MFASTVLLIQISSKLRLSCAHGTKRPMYAGGCDRASGCFVGLKSAASTRKRMHAREIDTRTINKCLRSSSFIKPSIVAGSCARARRPPSRGSHETAQHQVIQRGRLYLRTARAFLLHDRSTGAQNYGLYPSMDEQGPRSANMLPLPIPNSAHFRAVRRFLTAATPLARFIATADPLKPKQRALIVEQAIMLLENFYAHLPLKCAMYAVDPLRRLRLLQHRLPQFGTEPSIDADLSFHGEIMQIFTSVRDLHTRYFLPSPFQGATAFLPFDIESYFEQGRRKYLATHFAAWYTSPKSTFRPGVEILYWNGTPIARAVDIAGRQSAGTNPAARHANGLMRMTKRPLATLPPPDEEWVILGYRTRNGAHEVRIKWNVLPELPPEGGRRRSHAKELSLAHDVDYVRQARKLIHAPHIVTKSMRIARAADRKAFLSTRTDTIMVDHFRAEVHKRKNGRGEFGYIRIFKFPAEHPRPFVKEFERLLGQLPANGLVIDVRDNPGGKILAAEQLLQLLTSRRPIVPERLYFINTPLTLRLCQLQAKGYDLGSWISSIERSMETGATFSAGFPISSRPNYCNEFGQVFHGQVVLVTSALSYSAAEFFAAGFQDHRIGTVLGVDSSTGAAGAQVKDYNALRKMFKKVPDSPFKRQLPKQAQMTAALRRSTRVGVHAGAEVEDFGVTPDVLYRMTRRDLLKANADLIEYAGSLLDALAVRPEVTKGGIRLHISTRKIRWADGATRRINEIDVFVDWVLTDSKVLRNESISLSLGPSAVGRRIEIQGYLRIPGSTERHLIVVWRI